jgi:hypothetical protein
MQGGREVGTVTDCDINIVIWKNKYSIIRVQYLIILGAINPVINWLNLGDY